MREYEWNMNNNISVRIDPGKDDANREGAHVNIYKCGSRVGRMHIDKYGGVHWTSSPGGNINRNEANQIERYVASIANEVINAYDVIRRGY